MKDKFLNSRVMASKSIGLILLFQILSIGLVFIYTREGVTTNTLYFALALIGITLLSNLVSYFFMRADSYLVMIANMLFSIGVIMIYRMENDLGSRQMFLYLISIVGYFVAFYLLIYTLDFWKNKAIFFYGLTFIILVITLLLGNTIGGATNWIKIGSMQFQPTEFAKVPFLFYLASYFVLAKEKKTPLFDYLILFSTYALIGVFFLIREIGIAVLFFGTMSALQIANSKRRIPIVMNLVLSIVGLLVAYRIFSHIQVRYQIWVDPWADPSGTGYQIIQSLIAIASGGYFGKGIGLGMPQLIPLGSSDFIFSSITEEMGIFMGISIILLYLLFFYRGIKIAMRQNDIFKQSLALGVSVMFALQSIIVIGGVTKMIPMTGMTLPFMAYGGSSLLTSFVLLAILQVCSLERTSHEK